jgi:hypothetical protein
VGRDLVAAVPGTWEPEAEYLQVSRAYALIRLALQVRSKEELQMTPPYDRARGLLSG